GSSRVSQPVREARGPPRPLCSCHTRLGLVVSDWRELGNPLASQLPRTPFAESDTHSRSDRYARSPPGSALAERASKLGRTRRSLGPPPQNAGPIVRTVPTCIRRGCPLAAPESRRW